MSLSQVLKAFRRILPVLMIGLLGGCATADLQLKPSYQPVGDSKGPGGTVVLASALEGTVVGVGERIQWVLGEVKDTSGKVTGNVTSPSAPSALVRDALQQELLRAGYAVRIDKTLHKGIEHGLVLSASTMHIDEVRSLVKYEADCRVSFSVEIWLKGAKTNTLSFESRFSDFAVKDREQLHQDVIQKAFASAFKRAIPAIVEQLKK
jgi:hypothetical protein